MNIHFLEAVLPRPLQSEWFFFSEQATVIRVIGIFSIFILKHRKAEFCCMYLNPNSTAVYCVFNSMFYICFFMLLSMST